MSPTFDAFASSWPFDPWLIAGLALAGAIYARGYYRMHRRGSDRPSPAQLAAFYGALGGLLLALGSPIEVFAGLLLQVHMIQHLLLLLVVPPLFWYADPLLPLIRGLPGPIRSRWVAPVLRSPSFRGGIETLGHPLVALPVFVATLWIWHVPRCYELALASASWHRIEHACFLFAGLCFWYPVMRASTRPAGYSRWLLLPYLLLADVQNTVLAAWLAFSSEPIYASYAAGPRVAGISALADQQAAGVWMWVPGSLALLIPLAWIAVQALYGNETARRSTARPLAHKRAVDLPVLPVLPVLDSAQRSTRSATSSHSRTLGWDLGNIPGVQRVLRSRWLRPALQTLMFVLAALVIFDGLFGPRITSTNLAGVAPWIHWRGLLVLGLLVAGNLFCLACPFTLPRSLAARWLRPARVWPRRFQSKWLAVALVALFLWSYEAFALWDSPGLTAWIAIAYFVAAFTVDAFFRGEAFCKYVCPIGQFNFVHALVSPLEVRVRDADRCVTCSTKECIRGSETITGCGMRLAQPRKAGNFDCTFCLSCVQACPHDNVTLVALAARDSFAEVDRFRSGIGRLSWRPDIAALVVLFAFGAFANAAGMIAPVVAWQNALSARLGHPAYAWIASLYYLFALLILPTVLLTTAACASRLLGRSGTFRNQIVRAAYAFVPLGFAMWLAHYSFHFFTSYGTLIPVAQRFVLDWNLTDWGSPQWQRSCCAEVPAWLIGFELTALSCGLLWSLRSVYRLAWSETNSARRALRWATPWAGVLLLLFATGVWIVLEPMQMRGTAELAPQIAERGGTP